MSEINYKISGVVSVALLKNPKTNKIIVFLGDVHDGVDYCDTNLRNNNYVDEFLNIFLKNESEIMNVLLEEVPRVIEGMKLQELWPGAEHTQRLKNWYIKNQDSVIPIDIRPFLVPFSYQKKEMGVLDDKENNMLMKDYLYVLDSLFNLEELDEKRLNESIIFFKNILSFLRDVNYKKSGIMKLYKDLKKSYDELKNSVDDIYNKKFIELYELDNNFFSKLEVLKISLMDWYTVLVLVGDKHSIVHLGLYHYKSVINTLLKSLNFEKILEIENDYRDSCFNFIKLEKYLK